MRRRVTVGGYTRRPMMSAVRCGVHKGLRDASALETKFVLGTAQGLDGGIRVHDHSTTGGDSQPGSPPYQRVNRRRQPPPVAALIVWVKPTNTPLRGSANMFRVNPPCSMASHDVFSSNRCCGATAVASHSVIPKKSESNPMASSRNARPNESHNCSGDAAGQPAGHPDEGNDRAGAVSGEF